ncbi:MAG: type II toxin-antitoxin system ParD family antitoxin [Blastocatellia bacterium]|nr:type II toxin-antitoxin system ParD family antitoxin [Blastocatellia bacterium]MBK6429110.1 type II toxin-antitoxin system ParD family antitoxin [Blastocatellia bacterium]
MNVSLTQDLEQYINTKVATGMYRSASEVVREGLRLLKERDEMHQFRLGEMRRQIAEGLDQLDRGERIPAERVIEELRERSRNRRTTD